MRALQILTKWLFILCLPLLLLTVTIAGAANNLWLYKCGSQKYDVRQDLTKSGLELSESDLESIYAALINYYNSHADFISITVVKDGKSVDLFTQEETIHFRDVKGLIWLDYRLLLGTLTYVLAYAGVSLLWWQDRRQLAWGLVGGSSFTLALMLVLALLNTFFGFGQLFYQFHLMFFTNEFWSAQGYMLWLFPEEFFYDVVTLGVVTILVAAAILGGVGGYLILRHTRPVDKGNYQ